MNKWQEFAELHGMSHEQFGKEVVECAQAILAIELNKKQQDEVKIIAGQHDGVYQLTFKRIVK